MTKGTKYTYAGVPCIFERELPCGKAVVWTWSNGKAYQPEVPVSELKPIGSHNWSIEQLSYIGELEEAFDTAMCEDELIF